MILPQVEPGEPALHVAASVCAKLKVDGQRPDIVITKTACAAAALDNRTAIEQPDLLKASFLALSHRTREGGFEPPATEEEIEKALEESFSKWGHLWKEKSKVQASAAGAEGVGPSEGDTDVKKKP